MKKIEEYQEELVKWIEGGLRPPLTKLQKDAIRFFLTDFETEIRAYERRKKHV